MVSSRMLVTGTAVTAGIAGIAGGFAVDRSLADTPYRVESRVPDIARPVNRGYYNENLDSRPGWGANAANQWLPTAGLAVGVGAIFATRAFTPVDRMWERHPAGVASIAVGAASLGWFVGAGASRIALG